MKWKGKLFGGETWSEWSVQYRCYWRCQGQGLYNEFLIRFSFLTKRRIWKANKSIILPQTQLHLLQRPVWLRTFSHQTFSPCWSQSMLHHLYSISVTRVAPNQLGSSSVVVAGLQSYVGNEPSVVFLWAQIHQSQWKTFRAHLARSLVSTRWAYSRNFFNYILPEGLTSIW